MMDHVMAGHYTQRSAMQPTFTTRPEIRGTFGAVATTHWLATQTGMAVLERGGNAFDAAVAAGFVLQIVEPHLRSEERRVGKEGSWGGERGDVDTARRQDAH